jgi:Flp pilus assembly protein TadG
MVMLHTYPQAAFQDDRRTGRRVIRLLAVLCLSPLLVMGGVGVDALRGYMAQARLSRAVDAAALAGGRVFFDNQRNSHIRRFFDTTFPSGFLGTVPVDLAIDVDTDEGTLTVSGRTTMGRYFFDLMGDGALSLEAVAKVRRTSRSAEPLLERAS